jgi:hypothetical protein
MPNIFAIQAQQIDIKQKNSILNNHSSQSQYHPSAVTGSLQRRKGGWSWPLEFGNARQ